MTKLEALRGGYAYVRLLLKTASTHALGIADLGSGIAGLLLGLADHYLPSLQLMSNLGWQIGVWVFGAIFAARLIMAPYWVWSAQRDEISMLRRRLEPKLEILFDRSNPLCFHETYFDRDRENKAAFVAVLPKALGATPLKGCTGYLNSVWQLGEDGDWHATPFVNRQLLLWGETGLGPVERVDIDNLTNQVLNVFFVKKIDPRIHPCVPRMLNKDKAIFHERNTNVLKFDIVVLDEGGASAEISLRVQLGEEWNDVRVATV